jgi:hypothetical protein
VNPFRKLKEKAMGALLALFVKKLAEGDFGAGPAKVYWWLAGKKTWIALGLAAIAGALSLAYELGLCAPCYDYVGLIVTISVGLAAVGLFDGAVRITPPVKQNDLVRR